MEAGRNRRRLAVLAFALAAAHAPLAQAADERVLLLGPAGSSLGGRLERNLASIQREVLTATTALCSRDVVTRLLGELPAPAAVCFDGDAISVWRATDGRVVLAETFPIGGMDDRAEELAAARAVLALRGDGTDASPPRPLTIVANGPAPPATAASPTKDSVPPRLPAPKERTAARSLVGLGPAVLASQDGAPFAISADVELGVTRVAAAVPWVMFAPVGLGVDRPAGSATYRPTIFGFGFLVSLLPQSAVMAPRIGAGYSMLWLHVAPESANAPNTERTSEDLVAPGMYASFGTSLRLSSQFRVVGEALGMATTHEMVVRIAGATAARWGGLVGALALRGEWVIAP